MSGERLSTEKADIPVVRQGYGRDWPIIKGLCPACAGATLFLGSGGYVTCARVDCPDPCAPSEALGVVFADRLTTPPDGKKCRHEGGEADCPASCLTVYGGCFARARTAPPPVRKCQAKDFAGETWCPIEAVADRDYCWRHLPYPPATTSEEGSDG